MKCKKIIIFVLILSVALSFCACKSRADEKEKKQKGARENIGVSESPKPEPGESRPEPESKPEEFDMTAIRDKADDFLKAARSGEREQIQTYADYNKLFGLEQGQDADWILQQILMRMKYEIIEVGTETVGDKATVGVKVSNIDMSVVLPLYFQQAMELEYNNALSDKPKSQAELDTEYRAMFASLASKNSEKRTENTAQIELVKSDEGWTVKSDTKLGDALLGGYINARGKITQADFVQPEVPESESGQDYEDAGEFDYDAEDFSMVPPKDE